MKKFPVDISNEQIKELPLIHFPGQIYVIDREDQVGFACDILSQAECLGFDTETRPSFKRGRSYPLSLVQLATEDKCFLFRINKLSFPDALSQLLENPDVTKIGFDLSSDFHQIRRLVNIDFQGFVDLQKYAAQWGLKNMSLKKLAAIVLGGRLSKRQRLSNWAQDNLTEGQKVYAATDAWVTLMIYKKMKSMENS